MPPWPKQWREIFSPFFEPISFTLGRLKCGLPQHCITNYCSEILYLTKIHLLTFKSKKYLFISVNKKFVNTKVWCRTNNHHDFLLGSVTLFEDAHEDWRSYLLHVFMYCTIDQLVNRYTARALRQRTSEKDVLCRNALSMSTCLVCTGILPASCINLHEKAIAS